MKMRPRMAVLRRVAAAHMPALQAHAQMHPRVARLQALLASLGAVASRSSHDPSRECIDRHPLTSVSGKDSAPHTIYCLANVRNPSPAPQPMNHHDPTPPPAGAPPAPAIAIAARAFRNNARVRRASTSSTLLAISVRAAHTTSAAMYGSVGMQLRRQPGFPRQLSESIPHRSRKHRDDLRRSSMSSMLPCTHGSADSS